MIRIMLVDDHRMVRDALRTVLEQDDGIEVVAAVGDGETALRLAGELSPAVVVMDVAMPGLSGIETTRRLLARRPEIKVLALSTYLDRRIIQQMLDIGASGYIAKSAAGAELKQGIRNVVAGRSYLCSEVAALIADGLRERVAQQGRPIAASCRDAKCRWRRCWPKARARPTSPPSCILHRARWMYIGAT